MTDHTPTPWHLHGHDLRAMQGPILVCPATAHGIGDAKFILRTVNAHEAMLAALKELVGWWERPGFLLESDEMVSERMGRARAAIALAEKED